MPLITTLLLLTVAASPAASPTVSPSEKLLADYRTALERDDAEALAALFASDAELVDGAMIATGNAAIKALYAGAFAQGLSSSRLQTRIDSERLLAPNVRFVRGVSRITPANASVAPFCARFVATIVARKGQWRIATFSESALACAQAFP